MIGKTLISKNHGRFTVIGEGSKYSYYSVQFETTGNVDEFRKDAILNGEIRDKYAVTLCGVGIIGNIKTRGNYKRYYNVWRNMITRCYSGENTAYHGKTIVCDRWKVFENFYSDIPSIDGWNKELFGRGELEIDKDLKQRFNPTKIYSVETCSWLSKKENNSMQDSQQKPFVGTSPEGVEYRHYNISEFAREHGLTRKQISAVLHKRYHSTLGWKFKYIDEEIV